MGICRLYRNRRAKRPLIEEDPVGTDGLVTVRAIIPKGEIHADNLDALAEIAEKYGNQNLYTDNRQNLVDSWCRA